MLFFMSVAIELVLLCVAGNEITLEVSRVMSVYDWIDCNEIYCPACFRVTSFEMLVI